MDLTRHIPGHAKWARYQAARKYRNAHKVKLTKAEKRRLWRLALRMQLTWPYVCGLWLPMFLTWGVVFAGLGWEVFPAAFIQIISSIFLFPAYKQIRADYYTVIRALGPMRDALAKDARQARLTADLLTVKKARKFPPRMIYAKAYLRGSGSLGLGVAVNFWSLSTKRNPYAESFFHRFMTSLLRQDWKVVKAAWRDHCQFFKWSSRKG